MVSQASRLADVRYDIRGPVLRRARELEAAGHEIIKLNIGNPASFGLFTPDSVLSKVTASIAESQGVLVGQIQAIHAEFEQAFASYREIDNFVEEKAVVAANAKAA